MSSDPNNYSRMEDNYQVDPLVEKQKHKRFVVGYVIMHILGLTITIGTGVWLGKYYNGFGWTKAKIFNYHPLFMIIGLVYLYADSILMYRLVKQTPKLIVKIIHTCTHLAAMIFAIIALVAVFNMHNWSGIKNLYTLHSWIGLTTVILFCMNWVGGFVCFLFPKLPDAPRAFALKVHKFCGVFIFILAIATCFMGFTEKNFFSDGYADLGPKFVLSNVMGMLTVAFGALVLMLVLRPECNAEL